jgi:hypothetical protein
MGGMNRMEAGPEAAWKEDPKHRVGNPGAIREGAVVAISFLASFPALPAGSMGSDLSV